MDANGRFTGEEAVRWGEALAPYRLKWYEEPVDPLDYAGMAQVSEAYPRHSPPARISFRFPTRRT